MNIATPSTTDRLKVQALVRMRRFHHDVVDQGVVADYRRRRMPTSGMPQLVPACAKYPDMAWAPRELMVPAELPAEAKLPSKYRLSYYGLGKFGFRLYNKFAIRPEVLWDPDFEWNDAFPPNGDNWAFPTSNETFERLRLQGPNPWLLRRTDDGVGSDGNPQARFELDFSSLFEKVLPPLIARFAVIDGTFTATDITVGSATYVRNDDDPAWEQAKRIINAADVRYTVVVRHLLDTHLLVGEAFALAAYSLPTWHQLRPFMAFFTYGTLAVNDVAYQALVNESSYFVRSGFFNVDDARKLFENAIADFDLDRWLPLHDIAERGIEAVPDHPYVEDARLVWPAFVDVVEQHLAELGLDDEAIAADRDLQTWYLTLTKLLPNTDPRERPLDHARLRDLCAALLWNNVMHEVCGDFSPLASSVDPSDRAIVNLDKLRAALANGDLSTPVEPPTMADVFLLDQASFVSRFNVGGNNILSINAAKWVDDPKLHRAIVDLQNTLRTLEGQLLERNEHRAVQFGRMLPRHWEASISF
jgi:hypothetical protein